MPDILEYMREKLDWVEGRILELVTGLRGYKLVEVKARVSDVRRVAGPRPAPRFPSSNSPCDRY
jgi:hypothetical protein